MIHHYLDKKQKTYVNNPSLISYTYKFRNSNSINFVNFSFYINYTLLKNLIFIGFSITVFYTKV